MSQEDLATDLEIKRSKLSAIENGQTKLPEVDLSKLGGLKLRELEAGNDIYMNGSQIRVLAISVDKNNKMIKAKPSSF